MSGEITGMFLAAPSVVGVGETFSVGIKMLCEPYPAPWIAKYSGHRVSVASMFNRSARGIECLCNTPAEWRGAVRIDRGAGYEGPAEFRFADGGGPYDYPPRHDKRPIRRVEGLRFTTPGVKFLTYVEPDSGVQAVSNPIVVQAEPPAERLFWGDVHSQTFFSDGLRCPEELLPSLATRRSWTSSRSAITSSASPSASGTTSSR